MKLGLSLSLSQLRQEHGPRVVENGVPRNVFKNARYEVTGLKTTASGGSSKCVRYSIAIKLRLFSLIKHRFYFNSVNYSYMQATSVGLYLGHP